MTNYIFINGRRIDLTDDQTAQIKASFQEQAAGEDRQGVMLSQVAVGDTVHSGYVPQVRRYPGHRESQAVLVVGNTSQY